MKPTRFLWMLMVALLVPAMALSGCDKKKHVNRDDDDDNSSSGSSDSTEMVKKLDDITGRYEMDEEGVLELVGANASPDIDFSCNMVLEDNNRASLVISADASIYDTNYDNTMLVFFEVTGIGKWEYNEKTRMLKLKIQESSNTDFDLSFEKDNDATRTFIAEHGGMDSLKEKIKETIFSEFNPESLNTTSEYKITELNEDGFYARNVTKNGHGKIQKVKFNRID